MYVSGARANRKPVIQVLTPDGEAVGCAKIGIDPLTCRLVRAERNALAQLDRAQPERPQSPACSTRRCLERPGGARAGPASSVAASSSVIQFAAGRGDDERSQASLGSDTSRLPWPHTRCGLRDRLSCAARGTQRTALESALDAICEQANDTILAYGSWHGDWSPWNMASTEMGLLVWDWERFAPGVPLGFDALHHWLNTEVGRPRPDPPGAARRLIERAAGLLRPFAVGGSEARFTALLYLADLATRLLVDRQEEAGAPLGNPGRWLTPAIVGGLCQ